MLQAVQQRYTNERTAKKVMTEASRLLGYLRAWGVSHWDAVTADLVVDWCWTARRSSKTKGAHRRVAQSTARNRQWAARTALREAQTRGSAARSTRTGRRAHQTPIRDRVHEAADRRRSGTGADLTPTRAMPSRAGH